jgi:hypothetical protein
VNLHPIRHRNHGVGGMGRAKRSNRFGDVVYFTLLVVLKTDYWTSMVGPLT